MFKALLVEESDDNQFSRRIVQRSTDELPPGDLLVRVKYSSLNYKDALSAIGNRGVTREYPHTPGIDAAGVVEKSSNDRFRQGDEVIVTSYDLGMNTPGGFGQFIRVPAKWAVPLPENLSLRESMIFGTAGFTAGMSVHKLVNAGVRPDDGDILVTGATGGVGSLAVAILSKAGYLVSAVTGKTDKADFLKQLGAEKILSREEVADHPKRPLLKAKWAGVIDTVGGDILASALKSTNSEGAVTCCGLVASPALNLTVFPFILRGISLFGIDSQNYPMEHRRVIWDKLASEWKIAQLEQMATEIPLESVNEYIDRILKGGICGRVVVRM